MGGMEGAGASVSSVPVQQGLLPLLVGDATPLVAQGHWRRGSCLRRMAGESYRRFWSLPCPREPVCLPRASRLEKCLLQVLWVLGKSGFEQSPRRCGLQPQKAISFRVLPQWGAGVGGAHEVRKAPGRTRPPHPPPLAPLLLFHTAAMATCQSP